MISVILPYYNSQETIKHSIDSILNQTYQDFELLIINDGSSDSSKSIIDEYNDKRIKHIDLLRNNKKKYQKGINVDWGYYARNIGLEISNGSYITFQDSDDISVLNRLEIQLKLLIDNELDHLTISNITFSDNEHKFINKLLNYSKLKKENRIRKMSFEEIKILYNNCTGLLSQLPNPFFQNIPFSIKKSFFFRNIFFKNILNASCSYPGSANVCFFKSEIKDKIKFRDLKLRRWPSLKGRGADRDFNFQVIENNFKSNFFEIPLYFWRVKKKTKMPINFDKYYYSL